MPIVFWIWSRRRRPVPPDRHSDLSKPFLSAATQSVRSQTHQGAEGGPLSPQPGQAGGGGAIQRPVHRRVKATCADGEGCGSGAAEEMFTAWATATKEAIHSGSTFCPLCFIQEGPGSWQGNVLALCFIQSKCPFKSHTYHFERSAFHFETRIYHCETALTITFCTSTFPCLCELMTHST